MSDPVPARLRRAPLRFGVKINVILGLGLALLVAAGVLAYRSIDVLVDAGRLEGERLADLGKFEAVVGSVGRAESVQRKFLITADRADLAEYRVAREDVAVDLGLLRNQTRDPGQKRRLKVFDEVVGEYLNRLDRVLQIRQKQGAAAAAALTTRAEADGLNRNIRKIADDYREHEFRSLRVRRADTAFNADISSFLIFWAGALSFSMLVWAMVVIHRHEAGLRRADRALKASEQQLRLITDAVPALIGYVDLEGRLQFHNEAFAHWFGRPAEWFRNRALRELLGEAAWHEVKPQVDAVLAGRAVTFEFAVPWKHVQTRDAAVQLVPRFGETGKVAGYYSLVTDITALKEVDRLKNEFVSTVSHELRTPLTSIRGSLGLLAGGVAGPLTEKARELIGIAVGSCERLVRLVNDILDTEKMISGRLEMSLQELDLGDLVARSIRENEGFAAAHGVRVELACPMPGIRVRADPDRLVQVVANLLSNATRFSSRNGVIDVGVEAAGGSVKVSVCDRGPGVPDPFRARLFERFAQAEASRTRYPGGSGLGLSICKGIVERLGGRIRYLPREGGGSVFQFELPALAGMKAAS